MHKLIMDKVRLCVSLELRTGNLAIVVWRRLSAWSGEWRVGGEKLLIQFHTQTINSTQALAINRPSLGGDVNTRSTARAAASQALALCATGHAESADATLLTRLKIYR